MEMHEGIDLILGASMAVIAWVAHTVWDQVQMLKQKQADWERYLAETYVRRDDYKDDMKEIKEMLHAIFDQLNSKADK